MRSRFTDRFTLLLVLGCSLIVMGGCGIQEANLALTFKPGQITTYRLTTERYRGVVVRGLSKDGQRVEVPSGSTGSHVEMTYTQSVQTVDPNGHAVLDVRIKDLRVYTEQVGDPVIDFNSARPEDANKPLARLIGQGYRIEMGPDGKVVKVTNVGNAQMALASDRASDQGRAAARLLSEESIRERHTLSALANSGGGLHKRGQSWSQIQSFSFDNLGSKSFEKVYTFKGLDKIQGRPVAVIDMEGVLSSKGLANADSKEERARALTDAFDTSFTYTGQCRLDRATGQVEDANEVLQVQWIAVDPRARTDNKQGEPNSIMMRSTQGFRLQRLATTAVSQPSIPSLKPISQGQDKTRFALRFKEGLASEYRFTSSRDVQIQWDPNRAAVRPDPNNTSRLTESLELVMVYIPLKVDPDGRVTLEATFRSVKTKRTHLANDQVDLRPDPVEGLRGKTFTLIVEPGGRIRDANSLDALLKEIGELPFREDPKGGRIKAPDMISDVVATQWFLWDAISSMDPNGATVGQTWTSRLSVPTPMVMRKARDVRYTLEDIQQTPVGRVAVMGSTYKLSDQPAPASWPIPYSGRFRVSGPFGMLGGYTFLGFEGKGQDRFNLDTGVWEGSEQQIQMEMQAVLPPTVAIMIRSKSDTHPKVVIRQTLKMEQMK